MRQLAFLVAAAALAVPAQAQALTLEELGELHPERSCFTLHPDLELTGLSAGVSGIAPEEYLEGRGGEFEVYDVGDISFVAGPWNYDTLSGDALYGSLNAFLGAHENDYDFVTLFVTEHLNFGALYSPLQNDTLGIGAGVFDQTSQSGFDELEGFLFMNSIFDYTGSIHDALFFGQEVGHRWGSYVRRSGGGSDMLGRDDAHWSFFMDTDNSTMEGNDWIPQASGRWRTNLEQDVGYSQLDLYLMGFLDPAEVDDWLLIGDPVVVSNPYNWGGGEGIEPATTPYYVLLDFGVDNGDDYPVVVQGDAITVEIEDVTAVHGNRNPSFEDSQRDFRMAFVIMHPSSEEMDFDDYLVIEDTREELSRLWEGMVEDRATMNGQLGGSANYELAPAAFPPGLAFEPELDDSGEAGAGCQTSLAAGAGGASGLLLLLPLLVRARRRAQRA